MKHTRFITASSIFQLHLMKIDLPLVLNSVNGEFLNSNNGYYQWIKEKACVPEVRELPTNLP